jgi:hypothetical protein
MSIFNPKLGQPCGHCGHVERMDRSGYSAWCRRPRAPRVRTDALYGYSAWQREPGAEDEPGPLRFEPHAVGVLVQLARSSQVVECAP